MDEEEKVNRSQLGLDMGKDQSGRSLDNSVQLWDVESGNMLRVLEMETQWCEFGIWSVQFSSDGQKLASGSDDHTVRLWEIETGKCLQVLEGHLGPVYTVCFAPNGKYLVAAGAARPFAILGS